MTRTGIMGAILAALLLAGCAQAESASVTDLPGDRQPFEGPGLAVGADPGDVRSIDAIVAALYDVISGRVGEPRDWNRFRSLFHPQARLIPTGRDEDGDWRLRAITPEEYIESSGPVLLELGFVERELARRTHLWGNLAQLFSSYEAFQRGGDEPFMRGINAIQLWNDGTRWWVVSIMWQQESEEHPLTREYLR
ncbi:MAG: hypothetical protein ACREKN_03885 [Longimicrobiaceae bacterium]